ncbi:GAF and ANTAR domain-containing protein [Spirillospora sp. NPDC127200]
MLERRVAETFVELADTLVAGFDVIDLLHTLAERCAELPGVDAAGIMLADQRGALAFAAASDQQARLMELLQLQEQQGPCLDACHSGRQTTCADLAARPSRWPDFTGTAQHYFAAMHALPLRLRDQRLGAMGLFSAVRGGLEPGTLAIAQALADVAAIGIVHQQILHQHPLITEQLQGTLNSRVLIEQAKGVLAARHGITPDQAFVRLRTYARSRARRLTDVAADVLDDVVDITEPAGPSRHRRGHGESASP